jgi:hypothetical protein
MRWCFRVCFTFAFKELLNAIYLPCVIHKSCSIILDEFGISLCVSEFDRHHVLFPYIIHFNVIFYFIDILKFDLLKYYHTGNSVHVLRLYIYIYIYILYVIFNWSTVMNCCYCIHFPTCIPVRVNLSTVFSFRRSRVFLGCLWRRKWFSCLFFYGAESSTVGNFVRLLR